MKKCTTILNFVILTCLLASPVRAYKELDTSMTDKIDQFVQYSMVAGRTPGLSLAVVQGGETVYLKGYGSSDHNMPVTPQTPFTICSVGKVLTALAIRQLVGEGKVNYEAPVQQYIPWFTLKDPAAASKITIRNLIEHKSGLSTSVGVEPYTYNASNTIEDVVLRLKDVMPDNPAGFKEEYSNMNYIILGLVIEKVSGLSYGDYIQKNIYDRLDMKHSYSAIEPAEKDGLAVGHTVVYGLTISTHLPLPQAQVPAGFQMISAQDMAKIAALYQTNGYVGGQSIFANNELPEIKAPMPKYESNENRYSTYFTVENDKPDGYLGYIGHIGASGDYTTALIMSPERRIAVVVLTNCNNRFSNPAINAQYIANGIASILSTGSIPHPITLNYTEKLVNFAVNVIVLVLLGLRVFWVRRFRMNQEKSRMKKVLSFGTYIAVDGLIPLFSLIGVPLIINNTWRYLLNSNPQLWFQVALCSMVLAGVFVVKTIILLTKHAKKHLHEDC